MGRFSQAPISNFRPPPKKNRLAFDYKSTAGSIQFRPLNAENQRQ